MKASKLTPIFYSFVFVLTMNSMCAQETFESDTPDTAPINNYLIPMLLLGVGIGYHLLRKKTQVKQVIKKSL
jgi:hypothetical protein